MQGPTTATIRSRLAPSRSIPSIVASMIPATAPRRPHGPRRRFSPGFGVAKQDRSAVRRDDAKRQTDRRVTMASARGPAPGGQGRSTSTTEVPWT